MVFDDPFDWQVTKAGKLLIYRRGELVTIVSPEKATPLLERLGNDPDEDQQILARATGNYRRGNERMGRASSH